MIFPNYKYKNYHNGNKAQWAIQPPTEEAWSEMLREAKSYCDSLKEIFEFRKFKIDPYQLPNFHPYWKNIVLMDSVREMRKMKEKLEECRRDNSLIKVYFSASTTIADIEQAIAGLEEKTKDVKFE